MCSFVTLYRELQYLIQYTFHYRVRSERSCAFVFLTTLLVYSVFVVCSCRCLAVLATEYTQSGQLPISGVYSIMMENGKISPRAGTIPQFHLYPCMYSVVLADEGRGWQIKTTAKGSGLSIPSAHTTFCAQEEGRSMFF